MSTYQKLTIKSTGRHRFNAVGSAANLERFVTPEAAQQLREYAAEHLFVHADEQAELWARCRRLLVRVGLITAAVLIGWAAICLIAGLPPECMLFEVSVLGAGLGSAIGVAWKARQLANKAVPADLEQQLRRIMPGLHAIVVTEHKIHCVFKAKYHGPRQAFDLSAEDAPTVLLGLAPAQDPAQF